MRTVRPFVLALCFVGAAACAARGPLAKAQVAALTATESVAAIDSVETTLNDAGFLEPEQHQVYGQLIARLAEDTLAYVRAVRAWSDDGDRSGVAVARDNVLQSLAALDGVAPDRMKPAIRALRVLLGEAQ